MTDPDARRRSRAKFVERLAYYLLGVSIGLVILGIYWTNRQQAVQRQRAQQGAARPAQGDAPGSAPDSP